MPSTKKNKNVDKDSYNEYYKKNVSRMAGINGVEKYIEVYELLNLSPFYQGGRTKGFVRGLSVKFLIKEAQKLNKPFNEITVLDAGCGRGELSAYLACKGFNVIGVDVSEQACDTGKQLAGNLGFPDRCIFFAESLENISSVSNNSIDFIIGHGSLHHFIKYNVPPEFKRVMKPGAKGFFADSFGENKLYHLFHDKEAMRESGNVVLTKKLIENYFKGFKLKLVPGDWVAMLDKLYEKFLPIKTARKISIIHYKIDRTIPKNSRFALYLSGSVVTCIEK